MGIFSTWISRLYDRMEKGKTATDPSTLLDYTPGVAYWRDYLLERLIRIFEWNGLPMPQKCVESPTLLMGYSGFNEDELAGFVVQPGGLSGVTPYPFVFENFVYAAPKCKGGTVQIFPTNPFGSAIIISNNTIRRGYADLIDRYAALLAHADTTIYNALVNMRYDTYLSGEDDGMVANLKQWRDKIVEGQVIPVVDLSLTGAPAFIPSGATQKGQVALDALDARKEILRMFYAEIGIRVMPEKRGNLITAEVSENDQALLFNIDDMLRCRQEAAENINKRYGLKVTVDLAPEFKRIQSAPFDGDN